MRARRGLPVAIAVAWAALAGGSAAAAPPFKDIGSDPAGPLRHIYLGNDLSCQVHLSADEDLSFYPADLPPLNPTSQGAAIPGDCATFLHTGGTLYSPDFMQHTEVVSGFFNSAAQAQLTPYVAFAPVSQGDPTGLGTAASPRSVATVVDAVAAGIRITQLDTYINGTNSYRTDITLSNQGAVDVTAELYHAGDCFLANSDLGYGSVDAGSGATYCSQNANNAPAGRLIGFIPSSAESHYIEAFWSDVWAAVKSGAPLPDTCECTGNAMNAIIDNGAGLSWSITVPAGGVATRSLLTAIDPGGDDVPPDTQITDGPPANTTISDPTPQFSFDSTEPLSSFECAVDDDAFAVCSPPHSALVGGEPLPDGPHTFHVRAIDSSGNVDLSPADRSFTVQADTPLPECLGKNGTIEASPGPDVIVGTSGPDVIVAQGGDDQVDGAGGNDLICGRGGDDVIDGGEGNDLLRGGINDRDIMRGGDGDDTLYGYKGREKLVGGDGDDTLKGVAGKDNLSGGDGDDTLAGGNGNDKLAGAAGRDDLHGGPGRDSCVGGPGRDRIRACER